MFSKYCYNCGGNSHNHKTCKEPVTSIGIIVYRKNKENELEYLMIRRRNTFGYVEFLRGKYNIHDKEYIINLINEMTNDERKELIENKDNFDKLWSDLWNLNLNKESETDKVWKLSSKDPYKERRFQNEKYKSREKYELLLKNNFLEDVIINNEISWDEQEWEFPKGRKEYQESDIDTAFREFSEETGINKNDIDIVENLLPFEEIFIGSNMKTYLQKYFLAKVKDEKIDLSNYQKSEVSKIEWKTYKNCIKSMRNYNLEKMSLLQHVNRVINKYL